MIYSRVKIDFEFIDPCLCNAWVATAVVGAGVLGAGASIFSANKAADAQKDAAASSNATQLAIAQKNTDTAMGMYNTTRGDLAPYRAIGSTASDQLTSRLADLTAPITMDQATLENTPGYKFNLEQGQRAVTNSAAARGLGTSGAALKGAATFATGLADSTYQNQFNNANINQTNAYNRLKSLVDTGAGAAGQTGMLGTNTANNIMATNSNAGNNISAATIGAGNATAAADNKTGSALSGLANNVSGYAMYKGMYGSGGGATQGNPYDAMPKAGVNF